MNDILIVEDNKEISGLLSDLLRAENYIVTAVDNGEKALSVFERYGARLVLLDIMLPGIDGFYVCEKIRKTSDTPIIILSAKVDKDDKLNGLILGADDYMEKPYDIDILIAKINGIFKRKYAQEVIVEDNLTLNTVTETLQVDGKDVVVTTKEFDLLTFLAEHPNHVYTKEDLFREIWDMDSVGDIATVTVHIKKIREKIEANTAKPKYIETIWGVGYRFKG